MPAPVLDRRSLLAAAATVAAAPRTSLAATRPSAAGPAARPPALKLGLHSYSTRKLSLTETLALCRSLGIAHLTLKDVHLPRTASAAELQAARDQIAAAGVTLMGGGVIYFKNDETHARQDFEYARAAGMPLIVAAPPLDALDLIERLIKEYGIPVAIHNHGPEDKLYPSPLDALALLKKRDPRFGVCMDIGHTHRAGVDPVKCVGLLGKRLLDLHVKDLTGMDKASQVPVGRGALDIPGLFRALKRHKYAGQVGLEYEVDEPDPIPGIGQSLAYMRGVLAGIG